MSFFKTQEGKQEILDLYHEKLDELSIEYHYKKVVTSIGTTNIICSGNPENPTGTPMAQEAFLELTFGIWLLLSGPVP
jgi:histidinol-phosphate/aromatic aminotransferase/cobyric acid decarboxylase-like protein